MTPQPEPLEIEIYQPDPPASVPATIQAAPPAQVAINVEALIAKGIEHGASIDALERLLAMRDRLIAEQSKSAFFSALSAFQGECPPIQKSKTIKSGSYSYSYAPIETIVHTIQPVMSRNGLSITIETEFTDNPPAQTATVTVHHRDGFSRSSIFRAPVDMAASMNLIQKHASAQSYAKRYALMNALGIVTGDDDDDGQATSAKPAPAAAPLLKPAPANGNGKAAAPAHDVATKVQILTVTDIIAGIPNALEYMESNRAILAPGGLETLRADWANNIIARPEAFEQAVRDRFPLEVAR